MSSQDGFDIHLDVSCRQIMIDCGGFHDHRELNTEMTKFVHHYFGYIYDMLSSTMRLRVFSSNKRPYKWVLEYRDGEQWLAESTTGMLLFNYFGKKSEHILQNRTLPERENPIQS